MDVLVQLSSGDTFHIRARSEHQAAEIRAAVESAIVAQSFQGSGRSVADELVKLSSLRDAGVLTEQDWERAKVLYLGKHADARSAAIEHLRKLHDLYRAGVLSESEFNMKKWDVLSRGS